MENLKEENYYERLRIPDFSELDDIKSAFRKLAKIYHPDLESGDAATFMAIRTAYKILSDRSQRKAFDQELKLRMAEKKKKQRRERLEEIDIPTKLEIILAYSTTKPNFRPHFACSCLNQLAEGRFLSQRQKKAIDNVILSFEIPVHEWLNEEKRAKALEEFYSPSKEEDEEIQEEWFGDD